MDSDESPRAACEREIAEELGLRPCVGRLLCIEWQGPEPERTESVMLIYDGGLLPDDAEIRLPADELASYRFLTSEDLDAITSHRIARRIRAALLAADEGRLVELEHGSLVPPLPATWP